MSAYPASQERIARALDRRFTGAANSAFAPLREADSLVARMESIWRLRKTCVQFEFSDGAIYTLPRAEAARELRGLRRRTRYIYKTDVGYYVEFDEPYDESESPKNEPDAPIGGRL